MARKKRRGRHIPQRTCVGCRTVETKRAMTRVVSGPDGVRVDLTGRLPGRGAYLHDRRSCWERGLKGALAHALKTEINAEDKERLRAYLEQLPAEAPAPAGDDPGGSK